MSTRARTTPSDEDGFIIIEVLVSALILAIVAGAVLTLIAASTRGAAAQRDRGVGDDVAQADQARLRMLKLTEISGVESKERTETRNGTVYTIKSERVFDNNKAGAATCASASSKPDYVQLTSTVSSSSMQQPVVLQSVVSPSSGSLDENNGTLTAKAANAQGEPLRGISVTASSAAAGTRTAITDSQGCANFVSVPEGEYEVAYSGNGLVNIKGEGKATEKVKLNAGEYKTVPATASLWDYPATIAPQFKYLDAEGRPKTALADSMYVANATNGVAFEVGTPGVTPTGALSKVVFPFKSPGEYTVFAGYCSSNNPGGSASNKVGLFSGVVAPKAVLTPEIRLPKLELTVTTKSGKEGKEGTEQNVANAKVTLTDTKCKSGTNLVKRTYYTNVGGHLTSSQANVEAELSGKGVAPTEPALPFGAYSICASATINKELRKATASEVKVEDFTSKGTVLKLNLVTGSGAC